MSAALDVLQVGAVTPLGLSAAATCAAVRAGTKGFQAVHHSPFPAEPVIGGKVPASIRLRRTHAGWLSNLAVLAADEALHGLAGDRRVGMLVSLPESERLGVAHEDEATAGVLQAVQDRLGRRFGVVANFSGAAGALSAIGRAQQLLDERSVDLCCIGGVDSMVNARDIDWLRTRDILRTPDRPGGVIPSEGAAFLLVARAGEAGPPLARILGAASLRGEAVDGSQARPLRRALEQAMGNAGVHESKVAFTVTERCGGRQRALDFMIAEMQTFRTRRESLPHWGLDETCGCTGAAAGALALVVASMAQSKAYAPGPIGLCAASSFAAEHAACVMAACTRQE